MKKFTLLCAISLLTIQHTLTAQDTDSLQLNTADTSLKHHYIVCCNDIVKRNCITTENTEYNLSKVLDGVAPGMQTTNGGGQPGSSAEILVRGMSSLSDNNMPLIVLDGIPYYGDLSSINLKELSTVTLLKDATATFDFGNRGGNGILYITTKKKIGCVDNFHKARLEVDAKFGISTQAISDYETLGIQEYYETMNTAIKNAGITENVVDYLGGYNAYHVNGVGDSLQNEYLIDPATGKLNANAQLKYQDDWRKEMKRIGIRQNYNIASSARNDKAGYYLSVGYLNDKGYVQQTDFTRYSARFNGDYKPLKWLTLGMRSQAAIGNQHVADPLLFRTTQLMAPVYPVYYRNSNDEKEKDPITGMDKFDWGDLNYYPNSSIGNRRTYPNMNSIASLYPDNHSNESSIFIVNPYLSIIFLRDFTLTTNFSYNLNKLNSLDDYDSAYGLYAGIGFHNKAENGLNTLSYINRLSWEKEINKHHFNISMGNEYFKRNDETSTTRTSLKFNSSSYSKTSMSNKGYFSKAEYDYAGKYLLFAGFRRDATLLTESHWINNWVAGMGYELSKERFMEDINWITQLKLKASYGTQGRYFPYYNQTNMPFTIYPPSMGNNQIVLPDRDNQLNIGLVTSLFRDRISFDLNIYNRNSGESIITPTSIWQNPNQILNIASPFQYNNKGFELSIYTTNIQSNAFTWNTTFMITHNKNTIASMPSGRDSIVTPNNRLYKKGNSMADFYMVEYAGVDPNNGDALYYAKDDNGKEIKTNDYSKAEMTNRKNSGSAFPNVYGSLTNNFTYKNFELSIQVNYGLGGKYYDQVYQDLMGSAYYSMNWSTDILNSWNVNNRNTDVPKDAYGSGNDFKSSRFLKSASYLNIASLYLGYSFDEVKIKKAGMKSFRIYLTANNVWMFVSGKGMNPQGSFYGTPGYAFLPARNILFGLNVGI